MSDRRLNMLTEIKSVEKGEDNKLVIEGKAVAFESPETYWGETEVIDTHALDECDMSDVVLRYNHNDTQYTLARTRNKSLVLDLRADGLYFTANLNGDIQTQKDAYLMVKDGLLDKCSFAFSIDEDKYDVKNHLRTITKIGRMFDEALVDFPFYKDTLVEARGLDNRKEFLEKAKELQERAYKEKKKELLEEITRKELLKRL